MKTLTSTLEAAQQATSGKPYVEAVLADVYGYARRQRPARVYTGAEPEDPVDALLAGDGSLIRLRRRTQAATLQLQVASGADDGSQNAGTPSLSDPQTLLDDTDEYAAWRFQNVTIPQGATVLLARFLVVFASDVDPADPLGTLYGEDADNSAALSTGANDLSGRTSTTATVAIDESDLVNDDFTHVELADVTAIVQEIVNRGGWSSGNAMTLLYQASSTGSRDFAPRFYEYDAGVAAKLEISYATGSPQATVYASRVTTPSAGDTFSSWSSIDTQASALGGVALARDDNDNLYAFLVDDDLTTIVMRRSTNDGASWSSRFTVETGGGVKLALAAAAADDGDIVVFWAETDGVVYETRSSNGTSYGERAAWSNSAQWVTGLAATYLQDWQVIVTGWEAGTRDRKVWACRFGDGVNQANNTWGSLKLIAEATADSGVDFSEPHVLWNDVFRLYYVESYSGDEAYDRVLEATLALTHDFNEEQWREPYPFDYEGAGGLAPVSGNSQYWLVSSDGVWLGDNPTFSDLDVSADVVRAEVRCDERGAVAELELDNADGAYTAYGSGALGALQRGSRLRLTPGYSGSAGPEAPDPYAYWVTEVQLITGARPRLRLVARDGWALLESWRARRQFSWAAGDKTISQLLLFITGRAGVAFAATGGSSDALTSLQPAFTISPRESGATAVRRLLALVEDVPFWQEEDLTTTHAESGDTAGYTLGPGDGEHDVVEAVYRDVGPPVTRARVVGIPGVYGDESLFDDPAAERIATAVDLNLDAGTDATDRANAILRKAYMEARNDEVTLHGVHCAVELWDVVSLSDPQVSLSDEPRRVLAYTWSYEPERARYEMKLTLGNV